MRRKIGTAAACLMALLFLTCGAGRASAQQCPRWRADTGIPSRTRPLQGRLIYHDGIRQWFELKLDKPQCGYRSIEVGQLERRREPLEMFRGCRIRSSGPIDITVTGYFSLPLYQEAMRVDAVGPCVRHKPFRDYENARLDPHLRSYTVSMHVDGRTGDHPVIFHVRSGGREMRPWQAYASYWLTSEFVLYGLCGNGFVVDRVEGPPEVEPSHFDALRTPDDKATFLADNVAGKLVFDARYSCVRARAAKR